MRFRVALALAVALAVAVAFALVACRAHRDRGEHDKEDDPSDEKEQTSESKEAPELYAVPVPSCACATGAGVIAVHAPRAGKVLWHFGVSRNDSKPTEEISVFSGGGQSVMAPGQDARMLMACDGDLAPSGIVALVREDRAAAWSISHANLRSKMVWSKKLPQPIDASGISAPPIRGSNARVGCEPVLRLANGAFTIRLRDGSEVSLAIRDGTLTSVQ